MTKGPHKKILWRDHDYGIYFLKDNTKSNRKKLQNSNKLLQKTFQKVIFKSDFRKITDKRTFWKTTWLILH